MKKFYLSTSLFLLLLHLPFTAKPWGYEGMLRKGFHIGLSGSVNSTWIFNQNNYNTLRLFVTPIVRQSEPDYLFTWGGQVGAQLGYNFHPNMGLVFEPSYSFAGQKYDDDFIGAVDAKNPSSAYYTPYGKYCNVKRTVRLQYIHLPLQFKLQTHIGDETNFYVQLGPQVNVRSTGFEEVRINEAIYEDTSKFTINQKFQRVEVGLALGTGVEFYVKEWFYINMGLNSYIGLTDLNGEVLKTIDWYSKNDIQYQKSRNFYVGLNLGLHFYLSKDWDY